MCKQRVVQVDNGRRLASVGQRVVGDAGFGVGFDQGGIQVGFFDSGPVLASGSATTGLHLGLGATHHQAQ